MGFTLSGLASGLDTATLVSQLMQAERIPQTQVAARQQAAQKDVTAWGDLRTRVSALQRAAEALRTPAKVLTTTASSSDKDSVTATAGAGSSPGSYSFTVDQLAVAQQQSRTGLGLPSMTVGEGRSVLLSGPAAGALDLYEAEPGSHTVSITKSSSAPTAYGAPVLALGATDLSVAVNGGPPTTLSLQPTYATAQDLVTDLNAKLGSTATASLVGGRLQITGSVEGSTQSLALTGGAAAALGLTTGTLHGSAAVLDVDGKITTMDPEPSGNRDEQLGDTGIWMSVGSTLRAGTTKVTVLETTATTTLADLQGMLNAPGSPVSATLVTEGAGSSLVLTSTTAGPDGVVTVQGGTPVLTGLTELQAAKEARVTVGSHTLHSSTNSFKDVLPGVSLDLTRKPADGSPVTVTVGRDNGGTADRAKALVDAMNALLSTVETDTKYDVKAGSGGPLVGDSTARGLSTDLFAKAALVRGGRPLSGLGISTTRDGRFTLDSAALTAALTKDPDGVASTLAAFADDVATTADAQSGTKGVLAQRQDGATAEVTARQKQYDDMEVRLAQTEIRYKAQYAALETAMNAVNSQKSAMTSALSGLSSSS